MRARLAAWLWIFLGWTALALFFGTTLWLNYIALGREAHFGASLRLALGEWWIWALLTPIPVALAGRWPLARPHVVRDAALHIAAGLVVALVKALAERTVRIWMFGAAPYLLPSTIALHVLIYWAIVVLTLAAAYYRRSRARELEASRTEARLHQARLQLLASQLQPHFLFNALNTIAETVHEDAERADRMIGSLSDLLRATLQADGHTVTLAEELALAERYLAIQQARFGDRLQVAIDVPEAASHWPVPRLILQPLLETAIQHGVGAQEVGGSVRIAAAASADALQLMVEDNGNGVASERESPGHGIGLPNTRARLEAMYGDRARLDVRSAAGQGTAVTVTIPRARP
jgi:two-component system LytT family sensor kinase